MRSSRSTRRAVPLLLAVLLATCGEPPPPPSDDPWPLRVGDATLLGYGVVTGPGGALGDVVEEQLGWRPDGVAESGRLLIALLDPGVYGALGALALPLSDEDAFEASLSRSGFAEAGPDGWLVRLPWDSALGALELARQMVEASAASSPLGAMGGLVQQFSGPEADLRLQLHVARGHAFLVPSFEARARCASLLGDVPGIASPSAATEREDAGTLFPGRFLLAFAEAVEAMQHRARRVSWLAAGLTDLAFIDPARLFEVVDLGGLSAVQLRFRADRPITGGEPFLRVLPVAGSDWAEAAGALRAAPNLPGAFASVAAEPWTVGALARVAELVGVDDDVAARIRASAAWWGGVAAVAGARSDPAGLLTVRGDVEARDVVQLALDVTGAFQGRFADFMDEAAPGDVSDLRLATAPDGRCMMIDGEGEVVSTAGRLRDVFWVVEGESEAPADACVALELALADVPAGATPWALLWDGERRVELHRVGDELRAVASPGRDAPR